MHFFRLNLSRWTRRTWPTHWYLWPRCPRSPSINPLSTGNLRQKMGPAPAPQLTATLPVGPLWLTRRCESYFHLLYCETSAQDPASPCRHHWYCRGRLHRPSCFFLNIQCIYMDLIIPVMSNIPFMIILYKLQNHIFFQRCLKSGCDVYMHKRGTQKSSQR